MKSQDSNDAENTEAANGIVEKRRFVRTRTRLPAKIVYGNQSFSLDCTIRDISERGARVAVPNADDLPNHLILIEPERFIAFDATIRWRRSNLMGLLFESATFLDQHLGPGQRVLKMYAEQARKDWGVKESREDLGTLKS